MKPRHQVDSTTQDKVVWKAYGPGWWDAMHGNTYAGWSVAQQCKVRWVKKQPHQYSCGWYCFNDAIDKMIGPFKTPTSAQESCPLSA